MVSALQTTQNVESIVDFFTALEQALLRRPELADADLTKSVALTAANMNDGDVRKAADKTLAVIRKKRPDLAPATTIARPDASQPAKPMLTRTIKALHNLVS